MCVEPLILIHHGHSTLGHFRWSDWNDGWHGVKVWFVIGRTRRADFGALDLPSHDSFGKKRSSSKEEFMVIGSCVSSMCDALKVIQVELSLEGSKLGLLEELAHYFVFEFARTMNHERPSMWKP